MWSEIDDDAGESLGEGPMVSSILMIREMKCANEKKKSHESGKRLHNRDVRAAARFGSRPSLFSFCLRGAVSIMDSIYRFYKHSTQFALLSSLRFWNSKAQSKKYPRAMLESPRFTSYGLISSLSLVILISDHWQNLLNSYAYRQESSPIWLPAVATNP